MDARTIDIREYFNLPRNFRGGFLMPNIRSQQRIVI